MSAPSVSTDFHPSPRWSPQPPATRSLRSGAWVPGIKLVSGAGRVARVLDELLVQVAHVGDDVTAESLAWETPSAAPIPVRLAGLQDADLRLAGLQDADWHLESEDLSEEWDDDAPLALATAATTTVTVATNRAMTFSPVGDEFDPRLD